MMLANGLNTAWMVSCAAEALAFRRATRAVHRCQEKVLLRILRANQNTDYGRRYDFASIKSCQEYRRRVPITNYEALEPWIGRIAKGEANILTSKRVLILEPTGGSTSGEKLIPYTDDLRKEFQRALGAWIFDVLYHWPQARRGRAYWSVTPMAQRQRTSAGGIPIGFDDDQEYLSRWQRWAVSRLLITPPRIRNLRSIENARYLTLLHLLASRDLALMSVWSPTYLTTLFACLPHHWEAICADIETGNVRLPCPTAGTERGPMSVRPDPRRAGELRAIFRSGELTSNQLAACWPRLAFLSCWADASSAGYASQLQALFPQVVMQPKGLLATEGVVSFPFHAVKGSLLALRSHFLEFREVMPSGSESEGTRLAAEIQPEKRYRVTLTTGGGLYRYDLGDEVEVIDRYHQCPAIRFLGRHDAISDLVGEKLNEQHVRQSIGKACRELGIAVEFALVAPTCEFPPRYCLFLQSASPEVPVQQLTDALEARLRTNPLYRDAVACGQLDSLKVQLLEDGAWSVYHDTRVARGQRLGDIKPTSLDTWLGWEAAFSRLRRNARSAAV